MREKHVHISFPWILSSYLTPIIPQPGLIALGLNWFVGKIHLQHVSICVMSTRNCTHNVDLLIFWNHFFRISNLGCSFTKEDFYDKYCVFACIVASEMQLSKWLELHYLPLTFWRNYVTCLSDQSKVRIILVSYLMIEWPLSTQHRLGSRHMAINVSFCALIKNHLEYFSTFVVIPKCAHLA